MTREEYILLYEKYMSGRCTEREKSLLEEYRDEFILDDHNWNDMVLGDMDELRQSIHTMLENKIDDAEHSKKIRFITKIAVAASILIMLSVGLYLFQPYEKYVQGPLKLKNQRYKNDIPPGNTLAVLTLDNGSKIVLDGSPKNVLLKQDNLVIKKEQDGGLTYRMIGLASHDGKTKYNTVTTPAGGQYRVMLPDGTKIWLNSASSLRFPTPFTGKTRDINLSGEAYFEVAENKKMPFRVFAKGVEVKVLGTHFNIMAYNDERMVKTTLLEGSVEVIKDSEKEFLKPGQQASFTKESETMKIADVNVEREVAWKNGFFIFNEDIGSVMRKIGRWYNVDIVFEGDLSNRDFVGTISKKENVSEILNILELTEAVHFKIEGRRIIVMP